ncbi:Receptor-like protein 7 [Citrus sinensis]|nr:Receptor-like protein 7 [Citrus sinensis]
MGLSLRFFTFMHLVSSLLIFHLAIAHFTSSMQPHTLCHDQDRSALLKFIESLTINRNASRNPLSYPKVASWNQDEQNSDCCSWDGIKCDGDTGHVIGLNLSSSWLYGSINSSSSLFQLVHLEWLALADNHFNFSVIPSEIVNLSRLTRLSLSGSFFSGQIPAELLELSRLEVLDLSSNYYHLKLQRPGLANLAEKLTNLQQLDLTDVNISSAVPPTLANLSSLISLSLSESFLHGEFPTEIFQLPNLRLLEVAYNSNLTGHLPEFQKSNSLEYLGVAFSGFSGFGQDLSVLSWAVTTLDLSFNKLRGPLPIPVPAFTSSYLVSNNQLTGEIPPSICSLNGLYALDLSYNNLSGMLPGCLGNFSVQLWVLKLQGNKFHGFIPETFSKGTNLRMIDFSSNLLQGRVPKSLANCVKLKFLNLGDNQITDFFPSWLGTLPELEVLILESNNFHGVIEEPKACFEFVKLRIIDLSHNRFEGNLPSKHFECWIAMKDVNANNLTYLQDPLLGPVRYPALTYYGFSYYSLTLSNKGTELEYEKLSNLITAIILSNNSFVGEIPTSIANLKGLRTLNLSTNSLQGHIPPTLGNLIVLESLDLSNNKLSGQIPQQLGELTTLEVFDVSDNLLTGPIPRGKQFNTFGKGSFDGNPGLCGQPLSKQCDNSATSPPEEDPHSESLFAFGWKTVLIGYASGTVIGVVLGHIFSTRKYEWLAKTFRLQPKSNGRRRVGRHRQRM